MNENIKNKMTDEEIYLFQLRYLFALFHDDLKMQERIHADIRAVEELGWDRIRELANAL